VVVPDSLRTVPKCRDPQDLPFLAVAFTGKADYLVTGDRDLLEIEGPVMCPIITPERLLEMVSVAAAERVLK
jgi:predicted nucleic acid-binding protein